MNVKLRRALAVPGRLELPTFGLGNRCSIRLSYGTGVANVVQCIVPFERHQKRHSRAPAASTANAGIGTLATPKTGLPRLCAAQVGRRHPMAIPVSTGANRLSAIMRRDEGGG
jgi:hypothetical protein